MDDGTTLPERFAAEHLLAHAGWVRVMAGHLLADPSAADDLAQESLLRALRGRPADPERPRGWLTAIVRNTLRGTQREGERRAAREQQVAAREALPSAADLAARASVHRAVVDAVLALPEPYRATLLLRFFEEIETSEIARRRGEPVETVRTRLKRGLAQLRERLGRELDVETSGGARHRGLAALVLVAEPVGTAGAAAGVAAGAGTMAMSVKIAASGVVVVGAAWLGWQWHLEDAPSGGSKAEASSEVARQVAAIDSPAAVRSEEPREPETAAANATKNSADEPVSAKRSPRIERMRAELTIQNLGMNNIEDDFGAEMRAVLRGLTTETLDLEALIAYVESREESAWVVHDSLASTTNAGGRSATWVDAYENSNGGCSAFLIAVGDDGPDGGYVQLLLTAQAWGQEIDRAVGEAISPMLSVRFMREADGRMKGMARLDLREEWGGAMAAAAAAAEPGSPLALERDSLERRAADAKARLAELRSADALPRQVRWSFSADTRELTYHVHGDLASAQPRRTSRLLTDREMDALRRIYDRYQEVAKEHVAGLGEKPATAK